LVLFHNKNKKKIKLHNIYVHLFEILFEDSSFLCLLNFFILGLLNKGNQIVFTVDIFYFSFATLLLSQGTDVVFIIIIIIIIES
jgi:hypothetical protein